MKKVKARLINEEGDLVMGVIEVPMSDPRPEYDGSPLGSRQDVQVGNPHGDKNDAVKGVF
jgi:hypothetical protein